MISEWLYKGLNMIPTNIIHLITTSIIRRDIDLNKILDKVQSEDFDPSNIESAIELNKGKLKLNRFESFAIRMLVVRAIHDLKPKRKPNYFTRLTVLLPKQSREEIISDLHAMRKDLLERGTPKWYITIIFVAQFASIIFHSYYLKL